MNREWQRKATQRQVIAFIILAVLIATFFWPYARH
jgi:F0F1-type ATP synthase membrane subunit b/b'